MFTQQHPLFENLDDQTAAAIKEEIITTITNYEPRVELKKVELPTIILER